MVDPDEPSLVEQQSYDSLKAQYTDLTESLNFTMKRYYRYVECLNDIAGLSSIMQAEKNEDGFPKFSLLRTGATVISSARKRPPPPV